MIIHKILNNNVAIILDEFNRENIVCGRGIAFKKKIGDEIDDNLINQVFVLKEENQNKHFQELVSEIPLEYIDLAYQVIEMIKIELGKKIHDNIYISLSDHMYMAIQRKKQGIEIKNTMVFEIKYFYELEYQLGQKVLDIIENKLGIRLSDDEAAFIALHIVNSETEGTDISETVKKTQIMNEICNIVRRYFGVELNTESVYYFRFITHLKFFVQRFVQGKEITENVEMELFELIQTKYDDAYKCVERISNFIKRKYDYSISDEEKMYLTIHIERVVNKAKG